MEYIAVVKIVPSDSEEAKGVPTKRSMFQLANDLAAYSPKDLKFVAEKNITYKVKL